MRLEQRIGFFLLPRPSGVRFYGGDSGVDLTNGIRGSLLMTGGGGGFRVTEFIGSPLLRLDFKPHEYGDKHLQFGGEEAKRQGMDFTGRTGNEAAEMLAQIYMENPRINLPLSSEVIIDGKRYNAFTHVWEKI